MKYTIIILLLSFLPLSAFAQTDKDAGEKTYVVNGTQNDPPRRKDTADAAYEDMVHEWVLKSDGSVVYTYSHKLRLITPFSFTRAYGESFITYNPQWQTLEVLRSVTTMRDGKKVESPFNAYNEVLPGYAAGAAPYLGLKEMVVTHAGVEAGAVIDFAYRLTTKPGMLPGMMDRVVFGARSPIVNMTVRLVVPSDVVLEYGLVRDDVLPDVTEEGDTRVFTWRRKDIPIIEVEDNQPALEDFLPVLFFTTATKEQMIRHCLQDVGDGDLGPAQAVVDDIMVKESDPAKRAIALQRWVVERVGRMGGPLDILGFRAMSPAATLTANVGSDLDRAVLLAALCRASGVNAEVAMFSTDIRSDGIRIEDIPRGNGVVESRILPDPKPDIASLPLYAHPAVLCRNVGGFALLALDPSHAQSGPMPPQYWTKYFIELKEQAESPLQYAAPIGGPSTVSTTSDWVLSPDLTIKGKTSVSSSGIRSYAFDTDGFKGVVKKALAAAGQGMTVEPRTPEVRASFETVCEADIASTKPLDAVEGLAEFRVPVAPGGVTDLHLPMGDRMRTTSIAIPGSLREECRMTLHLPKNVAAVGVPSAVEFTNSIGSVRSVVKADGHDVEITRHILISASDLKGESYPMLLELLQRWMHPAHTVLTLRVQG
ncbi:MAG: DUF3857 domain-containing protein [Bacteroidetes bacterium]|nr:DUF3857 domain-containing protein [Bacteroidota bacterium]